MPSAAALALCRRRSGGGSRHGVAACWQAALYCLPQGPLLQLELGPAVSKLDLVFGCVGRRRASSWAAAAQGQCRQQPVCWPHRERHQQQQPQQQPQQPQQRHLGPSRRTGARRGSSGSSGSSGSNAAVSLLMQQYSTDLRHKFPSQHTAMRLQHTKQQPQEQQQEEQQQQQQQPLHQEVADAARGSQPHSSAAGMQALQAAGWSRREVFNLPNGLSMLRLLSGPLIASWILDAQWSLALPALAVSGATDWADGWAARRFNQPSVIGSYLDPLADKVLICSVVGALGWSGVLPAPVVGVIVGRDVLLVAGAFAARAKSLGWRWPGAAEFFRVGAGPGGALGSQLQGPIAAAGAAAAGSMGGTAGAGSEPAAPAPAPAAPFVQPLYISKVNTVFQLSLVGTCILHSWLGWPGEAAIWAGSALTVGTTLASCAAYLRAYQQGHVLAPTAAAAAPGEAAAPAASSTAPAGGKGAPR